MAGSLAGRFEGTDDLLLICLYEICKSALVFFAGREHEEVAKMFFSEEFIKPEKLSSRCLPVYNKMCERANDVCGKISGNLVLRKALEEKTTICLAFTNI